MTEPTPFAHAVALLRAGTPLEQVEQALRQRGLDGVEVELVLTAAKRAETVEGTAWVEAPPVEVASKPVPQLEAVAATCARCGVFVSPATLVWLHGQAYCSNCAARPEVAHLRAWRDAHWGRRDAWAWLMGFFAVLEVVGGVGDLVAGRANAVMLLFSGVVHSLFFAGVKVARALFVLNLVVVGGVMLVGQGPVALPSLLLLGLLGRAVLADVRTLLFFRLEPSEDELRLGALANSNPWSSWGLRASVIAWCTVALWESGPDPLPWLSFALGASGAVLGGVGASRVDLKRVPPVGQGVRAWVALVLGVLVMLASLRAGVWRP